MANASTKHSPIFFTLIALILVPLLVWLERVEPKVWAERLFTPGSAAEGPRHEPLVTDGNYLAPVITKETELDSSTPIIIADIVRIPSGVTLRLTEGAAVFVHEYGKLVVEGRLEVLGTTDHPVTFTTNETNVANRYWSGIVFTSGSSGAIWNTTIHHASPAITCHQNSITSINDSRIAYGNLGIYTESANCLFDNVSMSHVINGIIAKGIDPALTNMTITAKDQKVKIFK